MGGGGGGGIGGIIKQTVGSSLNMTTAGGAGRLNLPPQQVEAPLHQRVDNLF